MTTENKPMDPSQSTREWMDLKFASYRSEMRLLFVLSVAGNQLLSHLALSPIVGAVGNIGVIGVVLLKMLVLK